MSDNEQSPNGAPQDNAGEHLNIKVTDNNNEVFFKIKRSTKLDKLMRAFCERQGKDRGTVRFLFDGVKVNDGDTPENVRQAAGLLTSSVANEDQLDMSDGDTLEVHQEQIGGGDI
jgi:hypothetical protein